MCQHWLCSTGTFGSCYFQIGNAAERGSGPAGRDLVDDDWDALDKLHDEVVRSPGSRAVASALGTQIYTSLLRATEANGRLGEQRRGQLEARYAQKPDPNAPRCLLRVTVRAEHSAAAAATEIHKLGDAFARAFGEELRKSI